MLKRLLLTALIALPVFFAQSALSAQAPPAGSEGTKTRPNKQEIVNLMVQLGQMPGQQQNSKIDMILSDQAGSKTPRSDFMFCTGLAYLGNAKAQACVAKAYESGLGVVEDPSEAYTWYALACETRIADASEAQKVEEARDRTRDRLVSTYPHPTEEDLQDQVNAQRTKIAQYKSEIKKIKK
jgi:TPR repeat protein